MTESDQPTRLQRIASMRASGLSDAEIGMRLQITRQRVHALAGARPHVKKPKIKPFKQVSSKRFTAALKAWRGAASITQEGAAAILRCNVASLRSWEQGKSCAHPNMVLHLIEYLSKYLSK